MLELPGHADGHIGFLRDGVLVGGDHLLARITPAVGLYPESRPDPLGDYLASLERTAELDLRIVYPGHGEPIEDPAARAREIIEHHRERLDVVEAALADGPRSGFDVSQSRLRRGAFAPAAPFRRRRGAFAPRAARARGPGRAQRGRPKRDLYCAVIADLDDPLSPRAPESGA